LVEASSFEQQGNQLMKFQYVSALLTALVTSNVYAAETPYGSCPERAQTYQDRYNKSMRSSDLVCFQKALQRELGDSSGFSCPGSSQSYQEAYERTMNSSDLVCFQQALQRELK
jgi:hypothetical protein